MQSRVQFVPDTGWDFAYTIVLGASKDGFQPVKKAVFEINLVGNQPRIYTLAGLSGSGNLLILYDDPKNGKAYYGLGSVVIGPNRVGQMKLTASGVKMVNDKNTPTGLFMLDLEIGGIY